MNVFWGLWPYHYTLFYKNALYKNIEAEIYENIDFLKKYSPYDKYIWHLKKKDFTLKCNLKQTLQGLVIGKTLGG